MPIAFVSDQHSADPNIGLSTTMTVPAVSNGDFMIASVICQEANDGTSALIKSATLTAWTDLFTDGYSESGTTKQYVIDPASENRYFWWMGYRIASSEPASYTVEVKTGGGGSGYNRLDADIVAYSTATSISEFAATTYTGATVTALTCPAVTIAPGTKVFLPSVGFQVFGGVSVVFGAGDERFLLCGGWANNGQGFTPPAGFIERVDFDSTDAPRINVTWADLGQITVGFVPQIYRLVMV